MTVQVGTKTEYPILIGILDNTILSQVYKEVMDECDWDYNFALSQQEQLLYGTTLDLLED